MPISKSKKVLNGLDAVAAVVAKATGYICAVLLVAIAISVVVQVLFRQSNIAVVWLGELSTYCAIWVTFLGMSLGYKDNMLARVDVIYHYLPPMGRKVLEIVWDVIIVLIITVVVWSSRLYIAHVIKSKTKSPELSIPLWTMYMGPIVGYVLTLFYAAINIFRKVLGFKGGEKC